MNFLRQYIANWRRQKAAISFAKVYHAEARARTHRLVTVARGQEGLQENLKLLGIDVTKAERPRLATLGGARF